MASSRYKIRNVFGAELAPCGDPHHTHGSWDSQKKCSETGGGVHQVCTRMNQDSRDFAKITGQRRNWSEDRLGQNHCLCLGAYALHAAKAGPDLDLKCEAIPDAALSPGYVKQWSTWNGLELPQQIEDGVHRLVDMCMSQAGDNTEYAEYLTGLVCGMHAKLGNIMALPPGVDCRGVPTPEISVPMEEISTLEVGRLRDEYRHIFGTKNPFSQNNRNVGGHLWAAHILDHAHQHTEDEIRSLFSEYCPVSGSPISPGRLPYPYRHNSHRAGLDIADEGSTGVHHCCRPCICDLQDGTLTTKHTVKLKEGKEATLDVLVLRINPCKDKPNGDQGVPGAPAVHCTDGQLTGAHTAVMKEGGPLPIIGIVQEGVKTAKHAQDAQSYCEKRRSTGYRGGMGQMFRRVSGSHEGVTGHK